MLLEMSVEKTWIKPEKPERQRTILNLQRKLFLGIQFFTTFLDIPGDPGTEVGYCFAEAFVVVQRRVDAGWNRNFPTSTHIGIWRISQFLTAPTDVNQPWISAKCFLVQRVAASVCRPKSGIRFDHSFLINPWRKPVLRVATGHSHEDQNTK